MKTNILSLLHQNLELIRGRTQMCLSQHRCALHQNLELIRGRTQMCLSQHRCALHQNLELLHLRNIIFFAYAFIVKCNYDIVNY